MQNRQKYAKSKYAQIFIFNNMPKYVFYMQIYALHASTCTRVKLPLYANSNMQKYAQSMQKVCKSMQWPMQKRCSGHCKIFSSHLYAFICKKCSTRSSGGPRRSSKDLAGGGPGPGLAGRPGLPRRPEARDGRAVRGANHAVTAVNRRDAQVTVDSVAVLTRKLSRNSGFNLPVNSD